MPDESSARSTSISDDETSNMRARSIMIHAVLASLVMAGACRVVPRERSESPTGEPTAASPATVRSVLPPPIRAGLEAAKARPEPWTVTAYDLVPADASAPGPRFAAYTIEHTIRVPSARTEEVVRFLGTEAGYREDKNACLADFPAVFGIRLARGPVTLDLMIQCGARVALAATAARPTGADTGYLTEEAMRFVESLRPPPPPPMVVSNVPPPPSIQAAFERANAQSGPWTATAYDLVESKARGRRRTFATLTIRRTRAVPSERIDELVRWLSTNAGYVNSDYVCCPVAQPPNALGLRLMRGSAVLDFVIQCGQIMLGAPPNVDEPPTETGFLSREAVDFLESLFKGGCSGNDQ